MEHRYSVSGMSCGHCVRAVTEAVQHVDQAAKVQIDLPGRTVTVQSNVDTSAFSAAIAGAGYEVQAA